MRVLVTGGSGFVGWNLVQALLEQGHDVYSTSSGVGNRQDGHVYYKGMFGYEPTELFSRQYDVVFHQAANNDTRCEDYTEMIRINVNESQKLFQLMLAHGCKKFVYASSTAVYGSSPAPYIEEKTPMTGSTPYAVSKNKLDRWAMRFAEERGCTVVGLRYCNIYGPGECHKGKRASMINQMIKTKLSFRRAKLFKDGEQRRDWVHVHDVIRANLLALKAEKSAVYNCGSGVATSFFDLAKMIFGSKNVKDETGWREWIDWIPCPFADEYQNYTCCDLTKIKADLGYEPETDIETGVEGYKAYLWDKQLSGL
jgi:ADP-L-glycero-D-manno-heptose 6-epimerase